MDAECHWLFMMWVLTWCRWEMEVHQDAAFKRMTSMHVCFTAISPIAVTTCHSMVKSSTPWQSDALHPLGKCVLKLINLNVILGWIANQQILPSTESARMEIDIILLFSKHCRFCFYGVFLFNSLKNKSYHIKINNRCPVTESPRVIPN